MRPRCEPCTRAFWALRQRNRSTGIDVGVWKVSHGAVVTSGMEIVRKNIGIVAIAALAAGIGVPFSTAQDAPPSPSTNILDRLNDMTAGGKSAWTPEQLTVMERLRDAALKDPYALNELRHLSDNIGPRLSGSPQAGQAVAYVAAEMRALGAEVTLEKAKVPHWVRGTETAEVVAWPGQTPGTTQKVVLTALGGSVATPAEGLTAEVVVVDDWKQLSALPPDAVKGKILLFNRKFDKELAAQGGGPYTFVGTTDHAVSCLNYGNATATAAQARVLTNSETARTQAALNQARMLVSPSAGILGVSVGKSGDSAGEGAVIVYVDEAANVSVPATVNGVRTMVIPTTARAVALGSAPQSSFEMSAIPGLQGPVLNQAVAVKQQTAQALMQQNPAFFGVGVGQSLDNPKEAALVIFVDRRNIPAELPPTVNGLRTRYVVMDRLHVTRSYAEKLQTRSRCGLRAPNVLDRLNGLGERGLNLR